MTGRLIITWKINESVCLHTFMIICHSSSDFSENKNLKISIVCLAVVNISYPTEWDRHHDVVVNILEK